ncbi:ribosomal protein L1-like protein [Cercophora newfieldiana]|uniref:Ribosomal protein L1-like protein n=1 Tax=Cercophora newfieldiana TaxID=92897 RepID=A0AA40D0M7_9PEZI|nr:ribosomal protein L1-like protein [Cercophora newfieldiana]
MSKITVAGVREQVEEVIDHANFEHRRNFVETVELQVALKGTTCKGTSASQGQFASRYHRAPSACACWATNTTLTGPNTMAPMPCPSMISKNSARTRNSSRSLAATGKFPTAIPHTNDFASKLAGVSATIKFQLKKVLCLAVAVGNLQMTTEELLANLMLATTNYLVSLLKNGWQNVGSLVIKSTMSPPRRIF